MTGYIFWEAFNVIKKLFVSVFKAFKVRGCSVLKILHPTLTNLAADILAVIAAL